MPAPVAPIAPPGPPTVWLTSRELQERLRIGHTTLGELKAAGVLQPGVHFVRRGTSANGRLTWDLGAVERTLRQQALAAAGSQPPGASTQRQGRTNSRQVI